MTDHPCEDCGVLKCGDCPGRAQKEDYEEMAKLRRCLKCEVPWERCEPKACDEAWGNGLTLDGEYVW